MIFCNKIKDLLIDYLDNQLDLETKKAIKAHLSTCKECREELAFLRLYKLDMCSLEKRKAPLNFIQDIHKKMRQREGFITRLKNLILFPKIRYAVQAGFTLVIICTLYFTIRPFWLSKDNSEQSTIALTNTEIKKSELSNPAKPDQVYEKSAALKNDSDQTKTDIAKEESIQMKDSAAIESAHIESEEVLASRKATERRDELLLAKRVTKKQSRSKNVPAEKAFKKSKDKKDKQLLALNDDKKGADIAYGKRYKKKENRSEIKEIESEKIEDIALKRNDKYALEKQQSGYDYDKDVYDKNISVKSKILKKPGAASKSPRVKRSKKKRIKAERDKRAGQNHVEKTNPSPKDTIFQIKQLLKKYQGKIIVEKYKNGRAKNSYIILEMPAKKYKLFVKKLTDIVYINKSPSSKTSRKKKIRLKIKFIN